MNRVRIQVETSSFTRVTKWHVQRVLKWVSPRDLEGLESIRVIEHCPDDPEYSKVRPYLRGFLYNGHYSRKVKNEPPQVVLYASDVYFGIPRLLMATPIATLKLGRTLAHEIGHHVIATRGYVYQPWEKYKAKDGIEDPYEEKMAEAYGSDVIQRMVRHWPYKLGKLIARMMSSFLYQAGIQDYWDGNYQSAASLEFHASRLTRENEDAGQCYRHAMEKLKTQTPSPLSPAEKEWLIQRYDFGPLGRSKKTVPIKKQISSKKRHMSGTFKRQSNTNV